MLCETCLSPHDLDTDYKMDTFQDIICHEEPIGNESQSSSICKGSFTFM